MKKQTLLMIAVCGLTLLTTGCPGDLGKSIENSAASVSAGLKGIDPLALRKLIDENAELRDNLEAIQNRVLAMTLGEGIITLKDRKLELRVPHNTGSFNVATWVDKLAYWSLKSNFPTREFVVPIDVHESFMLVCVKDSGMSPLGCAGGGGGVWASNVWGAIQRDTELGATQGFSTFLKDAPLTKPAITNTAIDITDAHLTTGEHTITFAVTPVTADANGKWSLRGQLVIISEDNHESIVKEFDLLSERFPGHALNTPLPPVIASIHVK